MEHSTPPPAQPQGNNAPVHHPSVGLPAEYWNNIDGLYMETQQPEQHQPPPPQQQQPQLQSHQRQAPQGITWDHPILSQTNPQHERQASFPQQHEHVRDFYSGTPQSWGQNPSASGQAYGLSHQHPYQMQQVNYNSRPLSPGNLTYQNYALPGQYYQNAGLQSADAYAQPRHQNIAPRPSSTQQRPVMPAGASVSHGHQYILPATNVADNLDAPNFNQYAGSTAPALNYQNTINPQFLSSLQEAPSDQPHSGQSQFLFYNPGASSYERPNDPKAYQMYPDNLGTLNAEQLNARQHAPGLMAHLPELAPYPMAPGMLIHNGVLKPQPVSKKTSPAKAKKPRAKKTGLKKPDGKAMSESATDTSDSDLEFEEPEEPSPLPAVRPSDPEGAMQYDTIKAIWSPRNRYPNVEKIKSALVAFKDIVKTVRDQWKTQSQAMKDAENQNNNDKAAELRQKVVQQRQLINVAISTTIEKGHPIIVEKLGEHPIAVSALYSFLLDRHQASDYEGALFVNILKLLSRFTSLDEDTLSKTNISKLLPRILKKGIQPSKDLAQKILENAARVTKRKQESASGNPPSRDATPDKAGDLVSGTKRNRDGEVNGLPATKKMSTPGAAAAKSGPHSKTISASTVRGVTDSKAAATAGTTRPKASIAPPKPTSLFGSLASASKKPGTSNAARAAAAAAAAKEKASVPAEKKASPPPPPAKPAFSFGDILAGLNQPKETSTKKPSDDRPPETEEEREKRLRKEARRKLRVSWKPDEALTEVRLFTHDPEEVVGLGDDLKRDVGDLQGEGRMLKLHKDLDVEDDEEMEPQVEEIRPWASLPTIEHDNLSDKDQESNFIKRGGTREPDSPEKLAQENREATTLMVFYTSPADIPVSPKEPPPPTDDEPATTEQTFGEVDDKVKARAARYFAVMNPQPAQAPAPAPAAPVVPNGSLDIANLLKVIQTGPQQAGSTPPPPAPPPQPVQQNPLSSLEQTINMFRQQQGQQIMPQIPQIPQIPQLPQAQPQAQVPAASNQPIDFQKILAVLNAQKQMTQPQQPAPLSMPMTMPQSQPAAMPNLAAIVSQLSGNRASTPVSQPPPQSSGPYEDAERKRYRDMGRGYDNGYVQGNGQGNSKRPRMYVDPEAKKHPRAGSVPCRFWREGKCLKGDDCTFRHDPADLV